MYVVPEFRPVTVFVPQLNFVCQMGDEATDPFACTNRFENPPPLIRKAKKAVLESDGLLAMFRVVVVGAETFGAPGVAGGVQLPVVVPVVPGPKTDGQLPLASLAASTSKV